ncbi:phosphatidylinositol 4-phosphate 3-kinase C2 domain-containing subunit beta [Ochlerotatus camptorhynchus]|uniref:phosphatidylinositol 4-phosphate 3-kinase C2 domain-containing subunit beta n=1 Tax=Ochlerotatus camptorhynchus TaxID=644619 RepID=UPI0031DE5CFD
MASRNAVEMEKQFLADLEKAKALSMETLELEKIRKQRYSQPDSLNKSDSRTLAEYKNYLERKAKLHQGLPPGANNVPKNVSTVNFSAEARFTSEARNPVRDSQLPKGIDEADLISFNALPPPPNPQDEAHNNLKELVDQMHRLNTQNPYDHGYKTQRSLSMSSASSYGSYSPAYLQQQVVQNYNQAAMQIVPYQEAMKPKPLTPDELKRLYNMPTMYGTMPAGPPQSGFIAQPQFPPANYPQAQTSFPPQVHPNSAPTTNFIPQSSATVVPPPIGFIPQPALYSTSTVPVANPESALVHVPKPVNPKLTLNNRSASQPQQSFPPAIPGPSNSNPFTRKSLAASATNNGNSSSSNNNNTNSEVVLRPKSDPTKLGDNLIDLGFEDNSRVSVLEAFDPLLCGNRSSYGDGSEDDKDDTASTYYEDYDPFDYIYSGGTQYSDPVYEAVNRSDKTPLSPNSSGSGPPPIGWNVSSAYGFGEPEFLEGEPPPLPPRNSDLYHSMIDGGGGPGTTASLGPTTSTGSDYEVMQKQITERRSAPTKLYENVVVRKSYDKELIAFYNMVKQLRAQYRYDDPVSNVGHVVPSEFDNHYPEGTSIKLLVHPSHDCFTSYDSQNKGQIDGYGPPIPFTCDITTSVEHVIAQVFCALEGQIMNSGGDYVLKAIGIQEILRTSSRLNQLQCVHNSIKLEHDVQLGFVPKTPRIMRTIARTAQDDQRDAEIKLEHILSKEATSAIGYDDLMILLETLEAEIDKLQLSADDHSPHTIMSCSGVIQAVKAICNMLGPIDTLEITKSIDDLKTCCDSGQTIYSYNDTPPDYSNGSLSIVSESGDYAEVKLRPRTISQQIQYRCNEVRNAIQSLLEIYSHAFRVNFMVNVPDWSTNPIPISNISQSVMVNIMCLHRPPIHWKHDEYNLGVQIYHGARYISEAMVTYCSNEISGIYPRLKFNSWIMFRNPVCTLPRESRLIFVLYGVTREPVEGDKQEGSSNADGNAQEGRVTKVELGWSAIQFFDFDRKMIQGSYLLSLWPPTAEKYFGPAPAKGTHPLGSAYPILGVEIPSYGGSVVFPEPIKNLPPWAKLDFNSLDRNLQQELIDTAEQGYSADKLEKREVLWEKRHYLHSLPHALPKILHAAHSWDYACLADLHALLKSWPALTPVQALELLLPRYPDLEVRRQAVEWISHMPNDEFTDYLPQLLQALKHDTYEASPLSHLLLRKSLESPRIAHHLYWLLLHSLPGEAPQNMIEMGQLDEALVIQARYHRRNQLMLRALMATCGEKLTARFLSQNMMCKKLGEVAQSVKISKESQRLQILKQGLESVNQMLIDNPTVLPLGPGNEVTGVVVRSCNYFNSNTLPLKVNFMGSDKVIVPAIFKSGDDLQQDMLTIQMVRIMDKLWLREGLDLKMVTFDCVPTSYKKGIIEMVSDSETLRKIQVEWGLTGSFKDKSIAEWLAKQNPSQLEYQRAVENFTRSCAGYSVATYILGICDRHNDNIMLKTSGHLFHIDFGKFLGDAQMFGNFKRDRTPFVLTSDMAYVINGGDRPSAKFHKFVDLCCTAFNIVRKHGDLILHMFALMTTSGIPGVTVEAVNYVRNALLPGQSNPEAAASFAKMIHISLKSWFTQFNFFLHNIAQMKFSAESDDGELLSFVPRVYTMAQDGRLKSVTVHGFQKRYDLEKYYTYILKVTRQNQPDPAYLFRSYKEFSEFHQKLCIHFPLVKLHSLPSGIHVGRSNVKTVAERRLPEIRQFLISLFNSADEIAHSELVYTFFHPLLRDQQEADIHAAKVKGNRAIADEYQQLRGEIKFSLQYHRDALIVMIQHARSLPSTANNPEPNTYVKVYLRPDQSKATKRKTKVVRKNCNPSFMETLEYRLPLDFIQKKTLEVTVWSHDSLQENAFLGGHRLLLAELDLRHEINEWFPLGYLPRT